MKTIIKISIGGILAAVTLIGDALPTAVLIWAFIIVLAFGGLYLVAGGRL